MTDSYRAFLEAKAAVAPGTGFDVDPAEVHPVLKPHQVAMVRWAVRGGRRAIFASFGLGKTLVQLEAVRLTRQRAGGRGLICMPLGVRQEFVRDAALIGVPVQFIRRIQEAEDPAGIYLANYETVRDGKLDARAFSVVSLDEASILRGFGGSKTFREFMRLFKGSSRYRFVATATPDPNEYIELLAYAAFLDVMDVGQAKTRFFKRDSVHADRLTIHPHKAREFWLWVASWALFVQKPSDLGFSDEGYDLPPMEVRWHEIPSDHARATDERDGQRRLFKSAAAGVTEAAREKRDSLPGRVAKMAELLAAAPVDQVVIWCDLNDEQRATERALEGLGLTCSSLYGATSIEEREAEIERWRRRETAAFLSKPVMYGAGVNLQQCNRMIFVGVGFKFYEVIQAVHRVYRFLQTRPVTVDFVYTEAERSIRALLEEKWARHTEQAGQMAAIIREYGLADAARAETLTRSIGVARVEVTGEGYQLVNGDAVEEARRLPDGAAHLIITSIPFSTQYEYTPSYHDFGHTDDNDHFWRQMDFLTPELLRVLQPGRVAAIHVKDRIAPGGLTGLGFQSVQPFHAEAIFHYRRHGFAYLGMKTVVTDVVRENNQTYRLGWSEQCKDGSRMGVGMPEYVLLFRKPPTDRSNGYADVPVVKSKAEYSLARWQLDAHGFARSNGDRPLTPVDFEGVPHDVIYKLFRKYSTGSAYDFERHVELAASLGMRLPVTFMLLPPHSWHPDVWTDVARMRTLNMEQERRGQEMHLCPLQFDIVDRLIVQFSMEGETIYDPFGGLMTVPYCAVKLKRRAIASELSPIYFTDGVRYVEAAARQVDVPTLFDLTESAKEQPA